MLAVLSGVPLSKALDAQGSGSTVGLLVPTCSYESGFFVWFGIEVALLAAITLWGLVLAISSRNVPSAFNESTHILMCLFVLALSGIILLPIDFLVQNSPTATTLLRVRQSKFPFPPLTQPLLVGLGSVLRVPGAGVHAVCAQNVFHHDGQPGPADHRQLR